MRVAYDLFTEGSDTTLASHTPDSGGTWTLHPAVSDTATVVASEDRVRGDAAGASSLYYHSAIPISPNYLVSAGLRYLVDAASGIAGIYGRLSPSALTYYSAGLRPDLNLFRLFKSVAGSVTQLGTGGTPIIDTDHTVALKLVDSNVLMLLNNALLVGVADTAVAAANRAGLVVGPNSRADNFEVIDWRLPSSMGAG